MVRAKEPKERKRAPEAVVAEKPNAPLPKWLQPAIRILAAICLLGLFATEADDTDFWWHLKTGQYIIQKHALPYPDPFAYTTAMNPPAYPGEEQVRHFNLTHEWLAQVLMYGLYSIGGLSGVILIRAAMLAGLCGLVGLLAARRMGNFYAGIAAAFATASVAIWVTVDRPMIVTFLFIAVFITALELRRNLWLLPPLALIWANCHSGFFFGGIVLLAYCAESIRLPIFRTREMSATYRRQLWLVTATTIAISALNPNGYGVIATLLKYRQSAMTTNLVEWHRPYLWGTPYSFDLLLYAAALALIFAWRKVWLTDWLLFAAFGGAALLAFRNITLIGLLAPILIAAYLPFRIRLPQATAWAVPPLLIAILATGVSRGSAFQLHAAMWRFPVGAADYLAAHKIDGPLFNTYEHGGYLIWRLWPDYRVFIDGRSLSESLYKDYQQILNNQGSAMDQVAGPRAELLKRYGIQAVVMNTFEFNAGGAYSLALALGDPNNADWQLVYDDAESLIFLRHTAPGTAVFQDKPQRVLNHLENECLANIEHSPVTYLCARTLADFWIHNGATDRGRRMLQVYLQHTLYRDPAAEETLRQLGGSPR